jgi:methionyl-tRNA formyltransferase
VRVAILTSVPVVATGYSDLAVTLGHEVVVVIAPRVTAAEPALYFDAPGDLAFPESKRSLAPLLRAYDAEVGLCTGFPWLVPQEAIDVPRLGIVNGHPTVLPKGRGPFPWAWAVRNRDTELGLTYHLMDATFDTGNVLVQKAIPFLEDETEETLVPKLEAAASELLPQVFAKLESGDRGTPQGPGEYQPPFEAEYELLDVSRPAAEVHRQVRAWSFVPPRHRVGPRLAGRRVVCTSLVEMPGCERLDCADGPLWIVESVPVD